MKVLNLLALILLIIPDRVYSSELKYIPDTKLRKELTKRGFTTNDSLDLQKIPSLGRFSLAGLGIENTDGLQYFEEVWQLDISNNNIKNLSFLPKKVTELICSNNRIESINKLPPNLKYLGCALNNISSISNLPDSLEGLDISLNNLTELPKLPNNLKYLNYFENPINKGKLDPSFKAMPCLYDGQNCLPYDLMNWEILGNSYHESKIKVNGLSVRMTSRYGWEFGSLTETIKFKKEGGKFYADEVLAFRHYNMDNPDSIYTYQTDESVEVSFLENILKGITTNNMKVSISDSGKNKTLDLTTKLNGLRTCFISYSHGSHYVFELFIETEKDSILLKYSFDDTMEHGVLICDNQPYQNIGSFLNWLYAYKLLNATFSKSKITNHFFNKQNLQVLEDWLEE